MSFVYVLLFSNIICFLIGIRYWRSFSLPYKLIAGQIGVNLICEIIGYIISQGNTNNIWFFNIFYLLSELWITGLAGILLSNRISKTRNKNLAILLILSNVAWAINIAVTGINYLANWAVIVIAISLIIIYLNLLLKTLFDGNIINNPAFWISIAVVLYFSCVIPYFGLFKFLLVEYRNLLESLADINFTFVITRYTLTSIGFYLIGKRKVIISK